jgi:hypothetical protein
MRWWLILGGGALVTFLAGGGPVARVLGSIAREVLRSHF